VAWQQLTLHIAAAELPRAEAILRLAGAVSVAISDAGESPILEPEPETVPLWPTLTVRALFDGALDLKGIGTVLGPLSATAAGPEPVDDEAIERASQELIRPLDIGPRLRIVPANDLADAAQGTLGLHMGLAFGTGQHPTTRLCLEWLEREMQGTPAVLDYGCGSGVLALAALELGASSATAIDNEPQALRAARRNAELNHLEAALNIGPPASLGNRRFDLILANILAEPLIEMSGAFAALQPPGGQIVLSGILTAQLDEVAAYYASSYEALKHKALDGWCLLTARRRSEYDR
jgi:ribosomal protein L11 methyltransferase